MKKKILAIILFITLFTTGCFRFEVSSTIRTDGTTKTTIVQSSTMTEEEWEQTTTIDTGPLQDLENISGVTSVDYSEFEQEVENGLEKGVTANIETSNLTAFKEAMGMVFQDLGAEVNLIRNGDVVEFVIQFPENEEEIEQLMPGATEQLQNGFKLNLSIESNVTDHNATSVNGNNYEWNLEESDKRLFIKFNNSVDTNEDVVIDDETTTEELTMENLSEYPELLVIFGMIAFVLSTIIIVSTWRIFQKAGKPGWASLVPIYNIIVMLQITKLSPGLIVLLIIPFVNIVTGLIIGLAVLSRLSKLFNFGILVSLLIVFIPFIGLPMLAFEDYQYNENNL